MQSSLFIYIPTIYTDMQIIITNPSKNNIYVLWPFLSVKLAINNNREAETIEGIAYILLLTEYSIPNTSCSISYEFIVKEYEITYDIFAKVQHNQNKIDNLFNTIGISLKENSYNVSEVISFLSIMYANHPAITDTILMML